MRAAGVGRYDCIDFMLLLSFLTHQIMSTHLPHVGRDWSER